MNKIAFIKCMLEQKSNFMSYYIYEMIAGASLVILVYSAALIYICYKKAEFNILAKILVMVLCANLSVIFYTVFLSLLHTQC